MPLSRDLAEDLARAVLRLYLDAQQRIVEKMFRNLIAGIDDAAWVTDKLAALGRLEGEIRLVLARLDEDTQRAVAEALTAAYERGGAEAAREIQRLANTPIAEIVANSRAVGQSAALQRLAGSLVGQLRGTHLPILRWVNDVYRRTVAEGGLGDVLTGVSTRRQATQRIWSKLIDQGVTGFTDVRGRAWNLASYAEMATRTGVAQAAIEGGLDRMAGAGLDLVIVSNSPQECKLCRPWEGKVLSRSGAAGTVAAVNPATGETVTVDVAGTVDQAVAAGLLHPNCRHSLSAYLPGLTVAPTNTADPQGDAHRRRLRELERRVRHDKTLAASSFDPAIGRQYAARARATQAEIRALVASDPDLMRKPERERVNLGHKR